MRILILPIGAKPRKLDIPGEKYLTTSDRFLELDTLPWRVIMVGGGYISCEFAHLAARVGAQVQILHRSARLLEHFDPDLVEQLTQATQDIGIDVRLNICLQWQFDLD